MIPDWELVARDAVVIKFSDAWIIEARDLHSPTSMAPSRIFQRLTLVSNPADRFEINEAFAAQILACSRALPLEEERLNVNGGAIAFGHPLAATGVRSALALLLELRRSGLRRGIISACAGCVV